MSFPRYPAYKDSGVEWLGQVPEHWNRTALKFLADYQNGYPFKPDERGETGLPIIRISQLTGDDEPAYYSGTLDERVKVRNGDLLFSWSATIDSYIWNKGEAWLNQHIFRVSPSKEADKRYLYYAIKHVAPKLADFDAHGSTMRHIKKESLGEKIYVPLVFDQGLIATFLDRETAKIDALIAEQQRLIELLQEKRQAVISHAVTKGLNPDAPMKDSGVEWLGEVPEHWGVTCLKHATDLIVDCPHETPAYAEDGEFLVVRTADLDGGRLRDESDMKRVDVLEYTNRIRRASLEEHDIVYGREGERWGHAALVPLSLKFCLGQRMMQFRCGPNWEPEFLMWLLNSRAVYLQGALDTVGATSPHVNVATIRNYILPAPPRQEQALIAGYLANAAAKHDSLIDESKVSSSVLQERRSALISAAVTGQIDVRGLAPEPSAA